MSGRSAGGAAATRAAEGSVGGGGGAGAAAAQAMPTRERLIAAARGVVEEVGYGGASVLVIAERAGVASGTLYRHFPSKAELFAGVFRDVCGHELDVARAAAAAHDGDPLAQVDAIIASFADRALVNPTLAWSLIAEPVDPAVEAVRLEFRAAYRTTLAGLLREGIGIGAVPAQDAELTAAALVGAANEILAGPLAPAHDDHRNAAETTAALRTLWRRMLG
ncbi:MAG: TetR/AcrR family transcriptional regulator [Solirubrobacteraceae bacterium]|nr:TetR/AcrR family transcriptional regulator [Patulibacter sp.]